MIFEIKQGYILEELIKLVGQQLIALETVTKGATIDPDFFRGQKETLRNLMKLLKGETK